MYRNLFAALINPASVAAPKVQGPVEVDPLLLRHVSGGLPKGGWGAETQALPKGGWGAETQALPKGGWL